MTEAKDKLRVTQSKHGPNLDLTAEAIVGSVHAEDLASGGRGGGRTKRGRGKSRARLDTALGPSGVTQFPVLIAPLYRGKKQML